VVVCVFFFLICDNRVLHVSRLCYYKRWYISNW